MASKLSNRVIELCLVTFCLALLVPLWLIHFLAARLQGHRWLQQRCVLGLDGRSFPLLETVPLSGFGARFFNRSILCLSPCLLNVLRGQMSLVGPAALSPEEGKALSDQERGRFAAAPGLVHSYFLRESANIAFGDERQMALADAQLHAPFQRLGMLGRGLIALLLRGSGGADVDRLEMFGLTMVNETRAQAVDRIVSMAETEGSKRVAFVNPGCVNIAVKDANYRRALNASQVIFPDGIGIKIACRYLGQRLRDNLNGTDLFPAICERLQHTDHGIYLLGARPGVCEAMAARMTEQWPGLTISGFRHGYMTDSNEENQVLADINKSGASFLFVAMGVPLQELWIDKVIGQLQPRVVLGVGGLFDFASGRIPRAPLWVREIGMEWCFRLIKEPRRLWRRYIIGNIVFLWHMVRCHK